MRPSKKPTPAGAAAVTGSRSSQMPKTRMRTIPVTNSGTTASESPVTVIARSTSLPTLQGGDHAAEDADGDDEHEGEQRELERVHERVADEVRDRARRRCRTCPCRPGGSRRASPSSASGAAGRSRAPGSAASTAASSANGPRIARPGFPGRTCAPTKTITLKSQSVTTARASRRARKTAMASCPRRCPARAGHLLDVPPTPSRRGRRTGG